MMNPLKLALVTLTCASALSVTPYLVKKITAKESHSSTEPKANAPLGLADLPVETAPSLLSSAKADAESFAPTAELELKPSPVAAQPAPSKPEPVMSEPEPVVANVPAPAPAIQEPAPVITGSKPVEKVIASLPAPSIKVNLPAPSAFVASPPAAAAAVIAAPVKVEIPFNAEVKEAQEHLAKLGTSIGKIDGKLGPKTQAAIKDFQQKNGLAADGQATKDTLTKMSDAVAAMPKAEPKAEVADADPDKSQFVIIEPSQKRKRDAGPVPRINKVADVKRLQETLAAARFYEAKADGKWGRQTITAVEAFQKKNKLKVSGKPDEATWKKLNEVVSARWEVRPPKMRSAEKKVAAKPEAVGASSGAAVAAEGKLASLEAPKAIVKITSPIAPVAEAPAAAERDEEMKISAPESESAPAESAKAEPVKHEAAPAEEPTEVAAAVPAKEEPVSTPGADAETLEISKPADNVDQAEVTEAPTPVKEEPVEVASAEVKRAIVIPPPSEPAPFAEVETAAAAAPSEPENVASAAREDVVVRVNADAGLRTPEAMATPAVVSAEVKTPAPDDNNLIAVAEAISAPVEVARPAEAIKAPAPAPAVELPEERIVAVEPTVVASTKVEAPGAQLRDQEREAALEKEMEKAQELEAAPTGMVSNPKPLEITKSSARLVAPVDSLVQKVDREAASGKAKEEIEKAKTDALRKKAEDKVAEVEDAYKHLKDRFTDQVTKGSLANTMAKIDNGFTAMKGDFKKGNYSPIVDRCDGFKLAIEMLANDAAKLYVEATLDKKSVRSRLSKSEVDEIEKLCNKNKFIEAADQLDKVAKKGESKRS